MFKITTECNGCDQCMESCPVEGAIIAGKPYKINAELCAECGACVAECGKQAIVEE